MNHPITPPPELIGQWLEEFFGPETMPGMAPGEVSLHIATQAARWGADQELEACCRLLNGVDIVSPDGAKTYPENLFAARERISKLRAARRPKPPSLAEEALAVVENSAICDHIRPEHETTLRRALERLQELENTND